MTKPKSKRLKLENFLSSGTNVSTKIGILLLLAHFVMAAWVKLDFPELFSFYISDLESYFGQLLGLLSEALSWLATLLIAYLTVFGRRNLGFLIALIAFALHVFGLFSIGIDFEYVMYNLFGFSPFLLAWLISSFVFFPLAIALLVLGRPEVQKKLKKGS
jgi:hypothetical protein